MREKVTTPPRLLTTGEAAATLRMSRSKLYTLISNGSIRAVRIGGSRLIPVGEIERIVAEGTTAR